LKERRYVLGSSFGSRPVLHLHYPFDSLKWMLPSIAKEEERMQSNCGIMIINIVFNTTTKIPAEIHWKQGFNINAASMPVF
jgi:hypothetical protein